MKRTTKPTKREVFFLDGREILRREANEIACRMGREANSSFLQIIAWRDLGTKENPTITPEGPMWREYQEL